MKTTEQLKEEFHKKQVEAHRLWLENPTTQVYIDILKKRHDYYRTSLTDGILLKSDKETEDRLRSCITTCLALIKITTDSNTFVEQSTVKQQTTAVTTQ